MKVSVTGKPQYKCLDLGMTNFDHSIDDGLGEALQKNKSYADYPGWDFRGYVYWDRKEEIYVCEVWQYHVWIDTIKAYDLKEIMEKVSEKYGYK